VRKSKESELPSASAIETKDRSLNNTKAKKKKGRDHLRYGHRSRDASAAEHLLQRGIEEALVVLKSKESELSSASAIETKDRSLNNPKEKNKERDNLGRSRTLS